jgi:branched-chain amino acid transport system ATP-binding protein
MLEVRDIHTNYGDSYVLQGVSLTVPDAGVVAVLGRNGAGKTTLMRSIVGFTPPRRGQVLLDGENIAGLGAHAIARRGVGLVPQGRRIFPSLDVREHLAVGERRGRGRWSIAAVLDLFPRLRERLGHRGNKLSGGEQQMLACARALVGNPRIVLMDEPTEGLAPLLVRELGRIVRELKAQGTSILLVEQNLPLALGVADRVHILSRGQIVYTGVPAALAADEAVKSRYLGVT